MIFSTNFFSMPGMFLFGGSIIFIWFAIIAGIIFWLWSLINCAQRKFRNNYEKVVWILAIIFLPLLASLAYLLVIKFNNPKGILTV